MKCPKCGNELKEGQLYCESCGFEIQIVPDFEPEVEHEIHTTLAGVAEEIIKPEEMITLSKKDKLALQIRRHKKQLILFSGIAAVFLCIFLLGIFYIHLHSYSYEVAKAKKCAVMKEYKDAIRYMKMATEQKEATSLDITTLADYYYKNGEKDNAIITLSNCIEKYENNEEAYRKLIKIYQEDKKYEEISTLLEDCKDKEIVTQFQSYTAFKPEFSLKDDTYYEVQPLKISANTTGIIYYTTDGSVPTKASIEYTAPIYLESGDYIIKAIFVNNYGIVSDVNEKKYHIELQTPNKPNVEPYSGVYNSPQMISVEETDQGEVHFTIDGTDPTKDSQLYTGSITMPLGTSRFKFVTYGADGAASEITERIYDLKLSHVAINRDQAVIVAMKYLFEHQYLTDMEGHNTSGPGRYIYTCTTAISNKNITFYLITESYADTMDNQTKTGNMLAVNAMTGEVSRAEIAKNNEIVIIPYPR